ncbi:MAG: M48 family metalloprotease [Rhodothermales bacterium]
MSIYLTARRAVILLVLYGLLGGCSISKSPVTGRKRAYGYSWEQELQIGREADPQIVAEYGVYDDAALTAYVRKVGERVLANSDLRRPDTPAEYRIDFTFRVLDSPILNAFALPGGFVYVTRGLVANMDNEAQLAVVLGHEIGHVAARHSSQQALSGQLTQLGVIGGAVLGEVLAGAGGAVLQAGSAASQLLMLSYSRGAETEADQLGVEYAARSGYKAGEAAGFFVTLQRVSDKAGQRIPSWQSTHPDPGDREVKIRKMAAEWATSLTMTDVGRDRIFAQIDNIVVGDNPRQGFVDGQVFYHPDLAFRFPVPNSWKLYNMNASVVMTDGAQKAVDVLQIAGGAASASAAAAKFRQTEGLSVRSADATKVNGLTAQRIRASLVQNNDQYEILTYFIEYGNNVYQFLGYTTPDRYNASESAFRQSMDGFARLTDQSKLSIKPDRVDVIKTSRTGSFESFIGNLPKQFTPDDVAILNQLELNDKVQSGTELKLVH